MSWLPAPRKPDGVTGAAVGLIIVGAVNFLTALVYLLAGLSNIGGGELDKSVSPGDTGGTIGYVLGSVFPIVCLVLSPATLMGGVQMIRGRTRGLALLGSIVAIVPFSSCCFIAGVPLGIWAMVVLRRPEVQSWFTQGTGQPGESGYGESGYGQPGYGPTGYGQPAQYPPPPGYPSQYPPPQYPQDQHPQDPYQQDPYRQDPKQPW